MREGASEGARGQNGQEAGYGMRGPGRDLACLWERARARVSEGASADKRGGGDPGGTR